MNRRDFLKSTGFVLVATSLPVVDAAVGHKLKSGGPWWNNAVAHLRPGLLTYMDIRVRPGGGEFRCGLWPEGDWWFGFFVRDGCWSARIRELCNRGTEVCRYEDEIIKFVPGRWVKLGILHNGHGEVGFYIDEKLCAILPLRVTRLVHASPFIWTAGEVRADAMRLVQENADHTVTRFSDIAPACKMDNMEL